MEPSRPLRARSPRPQRTPPLLVIAAAGLVLVIGLGVSWLVLRPERHRPTAPITSALGNREDLDRPGARLPAAPDAAPIAGAPVGAPRPAPTPARASPPIVETPPDELPVWERPPLRTSQPFPEGARLDPPLPPIKIPPEMLLPPAIPDAGPARATGGDDRDRSP